MDVAGDAEQNRFSLGSILAHDTLHVSLHYMGLVFRSKSSQTKASHRTHSEPH